jgi:hypothetical protein
MEIYATSFMEMMGWQRRSAPADPVLVKNMPR